LSGDLDTEGLPKDDDLCLRLGQKKASDKSVGLVAQEIARREGEAGSSDVGKKVHGHRRKRSREMNIIVSNWSHSDAKADEKKEFKDVPVFNDESERTDEDHVLKVSDPRDANSAMPVLDGRRRHSSGSRSESPVIVGVDRSESTEDKSRQSIAEVMMEKAKMLNKSTSLNSLSGRSDDGQGNSRADIHRKSPSIESLPGSYKPEGSRRTHSNESLQSIKTDGSKRSHSNESLPGSGKTDNSRKSPSNESLPESIREEQVQDSPQRGSGKSLSPHGALSTSCRRTQSVGSAKDMNRGGNESSHPRSGKEASHAAISKLLQNLQETKESLVRKRSNPEDSSDAGSSKPHSEDERRGRRSRNHSESDAEGASSDAGSQLPPRAPSENSSGSHSDDCKHSRRGHRRTPSDHRPSLPTDVDPMRPTHSPIIMEGATMKKASNVRRNQSFHGLLPSKHQDTKSSPNDHKMSPNSELNEELSPQRIEELSVQQASLERSSERTQEKSQEKSHDRSHDRSHQVQSETPVRPKSHLRSRSPSPARTRPPVLSAAQLKPRNSDLSKSQSEHKSS